jgi:hypothetical protein
MWRDSSWRYNYVKGSWSAASPLPQMVNTEDAQSPFDVDDLVSRFFQA